MQYINNYPSPLGNILLSADDIGLTGLWFDGQKYSELYLGTEHEKKSLSVFDGTKRWLDIYFSGRAPDFSVPLHFIGTSFQKEIWEMLCSIPYGQTITYGELARLVAKRHGKTAMSAQAVGGAVGKNKISIIVPCHRVLGVNGRLTGYAGGIDRKINLLKLENISVNFERQKKDRKV